MSTAPISLDQPAFRTQLLRCGWAAGLLVFFSVGLARSVSADDVQPVAFWDFDDDPAPWTDSAKSVGNVELRNDGPAAPEFPDFPEVNTSLRLQSGARVQLPDHPDGRFVFDNGDEITLEAWVDLGSLRQHAYVISKGRTGNQGYRSDNQNWALRLRSVNGQACVNFLFRSRPQPAASDSDQPDWPGGWHRWTSKQGFAPGSGWHHIAVTYRFGDPDSLRGYLDGQEVSGSWDMDGATTVAPVVDDDEIWIGSTGGGGLGNSLEGGVDNLAVYRSMLPAEVLKKRFRYSPVPIVAPEVPAGKVVVQLFGPVGGIQAIPQRVGTLLTQWTQDEMGFVRLPHHYDDWGIRQDWGKVVLLRATAIIQPPAGQRKLLVRSRGLARLWIDDEIVVTTSPQKSRGSAHHVVDPLPEVPVEGMRPHAMNDREKVVQVTFDGKPRRVIFEAIVGGPNYRVELGESCVAIDSPGDPMFTLLASHRDYPLTDQGWLAFASKQRQALDQLDAERRTAASESSLGYWQRRHDYALQTLVEDPHSKSTIDGLLSAHREQVQAQQASVASEEEALFFNENVQPIFAAHCYRCHGDKEQGGLNLRKPANLLAGGESGSPTVIPHDPGGSYLIALVSADEDDYRMPPQGGGLTESEVQTLRTWIQRGASMPTQSSLSAWQPTARIDDYSFLRRAYLDTTGVLPSLEEIEDFINDARSDRRERLIDRLLEDPRVADHWVSYWQDVLAENPNLLKPTLNNSGPFRWWILEALQDNKPLDRFATELIMMRGSTWNGGTAGFAVASENDAPMAEKALVLGSAFLGAQMKCARCHDAPYHQWTQGSLFQLAAMLERRPIKLPSGSTVPPAFFEAQARKSLISVTTRPGETLQPHWPFASLAPGVPKELLANPDDTREQLAAQISLSRRFAEMIANRIWGRFMGLALVEPVDDWEGNPPSNPELLRYLADQLILSGYDLRAFSRLIMNSQAYQRHAIDPAHGMQPEQRTYTGPYRRRMTAEQVVDASLHAVGLKLETEMLTLDVEGTSPANRFLNFGYPRRAWEFTSLANERDRPSLALPRAQMIVDVLQAFGWRDARPEPVASREDAANLIQPAVLANGSFGTMLTRLVDGGAATRLALTEQPLETFVDKLFLMLLTRQPTNSERSQFVRLLRDGYDHRIIVQEERAEMPLAKRFRYVSWSNHLNTEANVIKTEMEELVRQGPEPTRSLNADWRTRAEDALWALVNSPEMVVVP